MRPHEPVGANPPLQLAERFAQQITALADPQARVIIGGLDPVDLAEPEHRRASRGRHDDRRIPGRRALGRSQPLRQPLEDRVISISRAKGSALFPAQFILIAAMNRAETA